MSTVIADKGAGVYGYFGGESENAERDSITCALYWGLAGFRRGWSGAMSDQDLKETVEAVKALRQQLTSSPGKALAFLVEAGIVTPTGELTEKYRQRA